eukprot:TRINITY_DN1307_c0_g1_i2.p1 TRINITY_DN1307_c0_g1~~TRINITY_DN1307_c0_g1_i2.p1  ORF type:complete len:425 (+),score=60.53 TRINITY_DN1307_c0_g1_i2:150-1277(+)
MAAVAEERRDSPEEVARKVRELAEMVRSAGHLVIFTGAGISTAAGMPDFRGPEGVWKLEAQKRKCATETTEAVRAVPTKVHMALVELQNRGVLKHLVSQNCDGRHRRSGIRPENISELNGNENLETCTNCHKEYLRDFCCPKKNPICVHLHRTGRRCELCGGDLHDSVINIGENLPRDKFDQAMAHARQSDLLLVLGSSLAVSPACDIPKSTSGKLVIVSLQPTPLDSQAVLRIFADCNTVMSKVMNANGWSIPRFIVHRRVKVSRTGCRWAMAGFDAQDMPCSFIRQMQITYNKAKFHLDEEPFEFDVAREDLDRVTSFQLVLRSRGHYDEPAIAWDHNVMLTPCGGTTAYNLTYDPEEKRWYSTQVPLTAVAW